MLPEIGGIPEYVWEDTSKGDDADQQLLYKELIVMVKELPPHYRVVFNLYVIEGYQHDEIAEMLGIQAGTSRSQLVKARTMLQKQIIELQKVAV